MDGVMQWSVSLLCPLWGPPLTSNWTFPPAVPWAGCWLGPVFAHLFSASRVSVKYTWTLAACYTYPPHPPPRKLPASILRILFSVSDSFLFVYFCIIISIVTGFSYAHNCSSGNRKHSDLENNTIVLLLQYTLLTSQIVYISYVLAQSWLQLFDIQCIELAFAKV